MKINWVKYDFEKENLWGGAPEWLSWLSDWLQLRSWSHSSWVQAPPQALCPHMGLEPTNCKIMTWAKVRRSTELPRCPKHDFNWKLHWWIFSALTVCFPPSNWLLNDLLACYSRVQLLTERHSLSHQNWLFIWHLLDVFFHLHGLTWKGKASITTLWLLGAIWMKPVCSVEVNRIYLTFISSLHFSFQM